MSQAGFHQFSRFSVTVNQSKNHKSLLKSTTQGDVVESIKYFYQIIVLGIKDGDLGGFRSMAVYVWSKEDVIQREILQE